MIFNVTGGGGAGLNFKLITVASADERPASAAENTIAITTTTAINGYAFSPTEPENPVEGMVWIATGTSGEIVFNALKKNAIRIFLLSAKQYVSGTWGEKEAQIYQNGAWSELFIWNGELYDAGNEYTSITGGWQGRALTYQSSNTAYAALEPTVTKEADHIHVEYDSPTKCPGGGLEIAKDIDLTDCDSITADVEYNLGNGWLYLAVINRSIAEYVGNYAAQVLIAQTGNSGGSDRVTVMLDISGLSGSYDIILYFRASAANKYFSADLYSANMEV